MTEEVKNCTGYTRAEVAGPSASAGILVPGPMAQGAVLLGRGRKPSAYRLAHGNEQPLLDSDRCSPYDMQKECPTEDMLRQVFVRAGASTERLPTRDAGA